jgi:hypothetical protein
MKKAALVLLISGLVLVSMVAFLKINRNVSLDIPIPSDSAVTILDKTKSYIMFDINLSSKDVVEFYDEQLGHQGWERICSNAIECGNHPFGFDSSEGGEFHIYHINHNNDDYRIIMILGPSSDTQTWVSLTRQKKTEYGFEYHEIN